MISIFKNINNFAGRWEWLDWLAIFCARFLIYLMILALFFWSLMQNNFRLFCYCFLSGLFALLVIARIIYFFYKEHRPAELKSSKVLIPVPTNPSFPSSHASFVFGFSFLLLFYNLRLGLIFLFFSLLVGLSRVFCGVHWFRDIVGGIIAGLLSGVIIYYLLIYIHI